MDDLRQVLLLVSDEDWVTVVRQMVWYCRTGFRRHLPEIVAVNCNGTPPDAATWAVLRAEIKNARRRLAYAQRAADARARAAQIARARARRRAYMRTYMRGRRNQSGT